MAAVVESRDTFWAVAHWPYLPLYNAPEEMDRASKVRTHERFWQVNRKSSLLFYFLYFVEQWSTGGGDKSWVMRRSAKWLYSLEIRSHSLVSVWCTISNILITFRLNPYWRLRTAAIWIQHDDSSMRAVHLFIVRGGGVWEAGGGGRGGRGGGGWIHPTRKPLSILLDFFFAAAARSSLFSNGLEYTLAY